MINGKDLPDTWNLSTIGEVLIVRNGYAFKSKDYKEEGILLVRQSNLGGNKVSVDKAVYLPQSYFQDYHDYLVKKGDILIGMSGSIGKLCIYDRNEPALQNQRTGLLVFKNEALRSWVWYFLPTLDKNLKDEGKGVAVQNISASQIEALPIPIAPPNDQKLIVAEIEKQFSRLDEAVEALKRIQANLKRYKASVLKAAVEGKLTEQWRKEHPDVEPASELLKRILAERKKKWEEDYVKKYVAAHRHVPKDDSWKKKYKEPAALDTSNLPKLPKGWIWATAEQLCDFITKGSTPAATKLHEGAGAVQFLKVYNLTFTGQLNYKYRPAYVSRATHEEELTRSGVFPGDILINIVGPPLGQVSIVPEALPEANINQAIARFRMLGEMLGRYFAIALMSKEVMGWAIKRAKTTAGQANLTLELCRALPVPLPPLSEQKNIVEEVEHCFSVTEEIREAIETNLKRADRLRQSILKKAFSGNLGRV